MDNTEPSGSADLQRIAKQALPYIAKELNLDRINLPDMRVNSRDSVMIDGREYVTAVYNPLTNMIELDQPLATGLTATWAVVHELVHAQFYSQGPLGMLSELVFRNKTFNETFTDVVALEVLADQAMAGNLPAKQALLTTASSHFKITLKEHEGEKLSDIEVAYGKNQADVIIKALNGQENYQGVKLDGLTTFLKTEFSAALQQKQ